MYLIVLIDFFIAIQAKEEIIKLSLTSTHTQTPNTIVILLKIFGYIIKF